MYIIKQETDMSLADIGLMFNRTHPTVHSNIESVKKAIDTDPYLIKIIEDIERKLKN